MTHADFHLAELNIARLRAPLDAPELKEFVDFLDPVNRFAEESPGFVWRLVGDDGQSSSYLPPAYDDPMVITNLSVWTSLASLRDFMYGTVHRYFLQSRRKWFERMTQPHVVLWWIPAGELPTLDDAKSRLQLLEDQGSTSAAFTLENPYDADGMPLSRESGSHERSEPA